jgi:hypothetical protein
MIRPEKKRPFFPDLSIGANPATAAFTTTPLALYIEG